MIGRNGTYFDPEFCLNGHFIITGNTNDRFCNDLLQVTGIQQELHRHLLEQGFEAVVFFDYNSMLYCYDYRSFQILSGIEDEPVPQGQEDDEIIRTGALGRRRLPSRRNRNRQSAPQNRPRRLNMGRLSVPAAWDQVLAMLRNSPHRCALVLSNLNAMQTTFPTKALEALQELGANQDDKKPNAVIYIFRGSSLVDSLNHAEYGSNDWGIFFQSTLRPLIETDDPEANRVIFLCTPNAAEVRNLLNRLRLQKEAPLNISPLHMQAMAADIAYSCAQESWTLRLLQRRLEQFAAEHPGQPFTPENWSEALSLPVQRPAMEDLQDLIGLDHVKAAFQELYDGLATGRPRNAFPAAATRFLPVRSGGQNRSRLQNICLTGNSGTGKTEIARLLGRLYYEAGVLPQGHMVPVSASDLVTQNVGGTPALVRSFVQQALGGVLFIDEAYSLLNSSHGREAIDQLVNDMTAYRGQFAVVMAGYQRPMQRLMQANEGLASRFETTFHLPDYTPDQMRQIFERFVRNDPDHPEISDQLRQVFGVFFENWTTDHGRQWGNAREAGKLLTLIKSRAQARAGRSRGVSEDTTLVLLPEDIPPELTHHLKPKAQSLEEAIAQIEGLTGLTNVKTYLRELVQRIRIRVGEVEPGRFIFHGPPGTGKTHMARRMSSLLRQLKILDRDYVYEIAAKDLLRPDPSVDYGTAHPTPQQILEHAVENARGGVLFIDEAHQLRESEEGLSLLSALVPIIEHPDNRRDICFILAGYTREMTDLLREDPGLTRRFPESRRIRFDDYTAQELTEILEIMARERGEIPTEEYLKRARKALSRYLENARPDFGNAGFIRDTFLEESIRARTARLSRIYGGEENAILTDQQAEQISDWKRRELTEYDLPENFQALAGPLGLPVADELSVWDRVDQLVGKPEVQEYLLARKNGGSQQQFYDNHTATGLNFAVVGPTGSGRHTVIRLMAAVWKQLGLLDHNRVRFISKASMEAGYVGQTAGQTEALVQSAMGGCLTVEYPSSMLLRSADDRSYGPEALGVIAGAMQNPGGKLSVVLLDTAEGLEETFRQMPSIRSSVSHIFRLEDLTPGDMEKLFAIKTEQSMVFQPEVEEILSDFFLNWVSQRGGLGESARTWSNGIELDHLVEELIAQWKNRNGEIRKHMGIPKRLITREMFPKNLQEYLVRSRAAKETALTELNDMVGLGGVKQAVAAIERRIRLLGRENATPGFYSFLGNPGVGKTTVAKLMGGVLRSTEVLSQGHVVARTARNMASNPAGFDETLRLAKNGILFIDEAPQLAESMAGRDVIQRLLTVLEDTSVTQNTCIILAGYEDAMEHLFQVDQGLQSRFGTQDSIIRFENYTPRELLSIMKDMASRAHKIPEIRAVAPLTLTEEFVNSSAKVFEAAVQRLGAGYGNARYVRNYLHDCIEALLLRLDQRGTPVLPEELSCLTEEDIPAAQKKLLAWYEQRAGMDDSRKLSLVRQDTVHTERGEPVFGQNYDSYCQTLSLSTVLLEGYQDGKRKGIGTGTIITSDGHVLTCNHVVANMDSMRARIYCPGMPGGDYRWVDCDILEPAYADCDMALLKLEGTNYTPMPVRPAEEPVQNTERTIIMGFPMGGQLNHNHLDQLQISNFAGRVASLQAVPSGDGMVERCYVDSTGLHGNSGSPVVSWSDGRLIGVFKGSVTLGKDSLDELNFFHPIRYFWERFTVREV